MPVVFPDPMAEATVEAMDDPQAGDRFSEMLSFYVYVVHREGDRVVTMEGSPPITFPHEGKIRHCTVAEMKERFSYSGLPDYSVRLVDRGNDVSGWYSPPVIKCTWCHKGISGEPYVIKQYPSTDRYPPYHTKCFVIAHRGQLDG